MASKKRKLTELHPEIEKKFLKTYKSNQSQGSWRNKHTKQIIKYLERLVDMSPPKKIAVTGCGPVPDTIRALVEEGYDVTGIEPVEDYVANANQFLNRNGKVVKGWCESIPTESEEFDIIFCESVLEHVDSPEKSLDEFFRVLKPGGVVYIVTENRQKFSILGSNNEYRIRFYNWFPKAVKEGYINRHLQKKPSLASFTPLPAVHWFTYSELCRLGRYAGFGKFYSLVDVMNPEDPKVNKIPFIKSLLKMVKNNMWLRAFFVSQRGGGIIFMYKRKNRL